MFDGGQVPNLLSMSPEEISSVFKKYMREIPHPLLAGDTIDRKLADRFSEVLELGTVDLKIKRIRKLLKKLSVFRRNLCRELFYILYLVSLERQNNKMDSHNLATIFGGMVNIISDTMSSVAKTDLCTFITQYFPLIWKGLDEPKTKPFSQLTPDTTKATISIYLDDGTWKTFLVPKSINCSELTEVVCAKLKHGIMDESKLKAYTMFEIHDREIRLVEPDEHVFQIYDRSSILLFTDKIDLSYIGNALPLDPDITYPDHIEDEVETEDEEESNEGNFLSISLTNPIVPIEETINEDITSSRVPLSARPPITKKTPIAVREKKSDKHLKSAEDSKAKRRRSKLKANWFHKNSDETALDDIQSLLLQFNSKEKGYLELLNTWTTQVKAPLISENLVDVETLNDLFPHFDDIVSLHDGLKAHLDNFTSISTFLSLRISVYSSYSYKHGLAQSSFQTLKQENPKFEEFITKFHKNTGTELIHIINAPSVRLQELEDIMKRFLSINPDESVFHIYTSIQEIVTKVRQKESVSPDIRQIWDSIEKIPETAEITPSRKIILRGEGSVKFPEEKKSKPSIHIILFNDLLFFYSSQKKFGRRTKETCEAVFIIFKAQVTEEQVENGPGIKFSSGDGLVVYLSDLQDTPNWFTTIQHTIKSLQFIHPHSMTESWWYGTTANKKRNQRKSFAGVTKQSMLKRTDLRSKTDHIEVVVSDEFSPASARHTKKEVWAIKRVAPKKALLVEDIDTSSALSPKAKTDRTFSPKLNSKSTDKKQKLIEPSIHVETKPVTKPRARSIPTSSDIKPITLTEDSHNNKHPTSDASPTEHHPPNHNKHSPQNPNGDDQESEKSGEGKLVPITEKEEANTDQDPPNPKVD
eukprot:TRINITY_DN18160_c0_g1_i1.p1 TRINITY_DN18160_c0_g1~~TRINITY_DN18160_c0_g1_i1.p1  ORF type:complete len:985 (-),score=223.84 TRINITY_DN18160_c0_g1_i1:60-2666(-)